MSCIGHAVGRKVAWPKSKVEVDKENLNDSVNYATSPMKSTPVVMKKSEHVSINFQN